MMNLNNATTDHLSDVDLDWVSGGMDCKTAIAVSQAYAAAAGVMLGIGDTSQSIIFSRTASDVLNDVARRKQTSGLSTGVVLPVLGKRT